MRKIRIAGRRQKMNFTILTLFPEMFEGFRENSIIRRAAEQNIISLKPVNIRDFTADRHKTVDDSPYGGGCGMVMKPEPLAQAIRQAKQNCPQAKTILMTPQGRRFDQKLAEEMAGEKSLVFVCGRYEGIDERIVSLMDAEISIGDYVLTGGELAAMVIVDAVTRLLPGALGGADSAAEDSFSAGLLEHAQYTRPMTFEGESVPEVLLSGHHQEIDKWRRENALIRTFLKRPDLLKNRHLDIWEMEILKKWRSEIETIIQNQTVSGTDSLSGRQQKRSDHCLGCHQSGSS